MATRFYFSKIAPNAILHAPMVGTWAGGFLTTPQSPVQWSWRLVTTKVGAGARFNPTLSTNQQGNFDALFSEWRTYPLDAQTISGTFDLCTLVSALWLTDVTPSADSVVRYKVHIYISVGQSRTVRHTLLTNYIDITDLNPTGILTWQQLDAAQTLATEATEDGDCVVIEVGVRIVSSPTPAPTYPPSANTSIQMWMTGTVAANGDGTAGSNDSSLNAWCEFSHTFTFQPLPSPPANGTCATALPIATFPHQSAAIDCSQASGTQRETFWSFTASLSGRMVFHNFGSNFGTDIDLFKNCALAAPDGNGVTGDNTLATHRSQSCLVFDVVAGSTYIARVRNSTQTLNAVSGGGIVKFGAYYVSAPAVDDLYLPSGVIAAYREGLQVNVNPDFTDSFPTGVAIDYTQRPMVDVGNGGTSTGMRLLVGLFSFDLVEILDLTTLNAGESEIDFISDTWDLGIPGPAQLYCTAAGMLYVGWFGNGFLYVLGTGTSRPAVMNTISSNADFSALKVIDATHGDNQPGGPFPAARLLPSAPPSATWALQLDETSSILYYTSGGVYLTLAAQTVQRFNVSTAAQLADFATLPSGGGFNPDVKGMVLLADRSLLVCNARSVVKLSAAGAILATYTPSVPLDALSLIDVKLTADQRYFWVVDLWTTALFKFDLVTGLEVGYHPTYLRPGSLVQMALYNPAGQPPPTPVTPTTTVCPPVSWLTAATPGCVAIGEL